MMKINRSTLILSMAAPISIVVISLVLIATRDPAPDAARQSDSATVAKSRPKAARKPPARAKTAPEEAEETEDVGSRVPASLDRPGRLPREALRKGEPPKRVFDAKNEQQFAVSVNPPVEVVEGFLAQTDLNKFGNPQGEGLGLAEQGEFAGARLAVWTREPEVIQYVYTSDNPLWATLKEKGFDVELRQGNFQPGWLQDADQLWIFTSPKSTLTNIDISNIIGFIESGKGLYLVADNAPYVAEARQLAGRLYGTDVSGNFEGRNLIAVRGHGVTREDFRRAGLPKRFNRDDGETRSRLEVINKATHYADEHPLLTDVNFIFEGVTISHLDPVQRLQTVLRASDGQILAAVAVDPAQRVLVDCGFTRYYYGSRPRTRLVTETAGTLRYAENIAAYLMGKEYKGGGLRWQERRELVTKYLNASKLEIVAALRNPNPNERWAAVTVALRNKLNIPEPLVGLIEDVRPDISGQAHKALVQLASGQDYGPRWNASAAERATARRAWDGWLKRIKALQKAMSLPQEEIAALLRRSDPDERAAALTAALRRKLDLPEAYITLLADRDSETREVAHKALVQLALGDDLGPAPGAGEWARSVAIENWQNWHLLRKYRDLATVATISEISVALHSREVEQRRAAVLAIRKRQLPMGNELIDTLSDPDGIVQQSARKTLVVLAGTEDHGPDSGAPAAAIAKAKREWKAWWDRKDQRIRTQMLKLAKSLMASDPASARERLQEIVDRYRDTDEAREAQTLLDKK